MRKKKNSESQDCYQITSLWLFPELQSWPENSRSALSQEQELFETQRKKRRSNAHRHFEMTMVAVNDNGRPVGEDHKNAKYLNEDVERAISLRMQGFTYARISQMLDMPIRTIRCYVKGIRRNQSIADFKRIKRYVDD